MKTLLLSLLTFAFVCGTETDAVYSYLSKTYELKENGEVVYHHEHRLRLDSYFATNRHYGETFIIYDTTHQDLRIHRSITTMRNGTRVSSPDNAFNPVLPRMAAKAPAYNQLREMVITHTGLETGAVIDLSYSLTSGAGFLPGLAWAGLLAGDAPIDTLIVTVIIPEGQTLHYETKGWDVKPEISSHTGPVTYKWTGTGLRAAPDEPEANPEGPFLFFSTRPDYRSAFPDELFTATACKQIDAALEKQLGDTETEVAKTLTLQKYIANNIATYPIPLEMTAYRFRPIKAVWESNGGTVLEKARLLKDALSRFQIPARLIFIADNHEITGTVAVPASIEDVLVEASPEDVPPLLLPVDKPFKTSDGYKLRSRMRLTEEDGSLKQMRPVTHKTGQSKSDWKGEVALGEAAVNGKFKAALSGLFHPVAELRADPETLGKHLSASAGNMRISEANIRDVSTDKLACMVEFTQAAPDTGRDQVVFTLPQPLQVMKMVYNHPMELSRQTDLLLPSTVDHMMELEIKKPASWHYYGSALDIKEENAIGSVRIQLNAKNDVLQVKRSLTLNKTRIQPGEYALFVALWRIWMNERYQEFTFLRQ